MSKSGNRKSRSNEGFLLYQNNVGKTVQTSWRPQLPLPKEVVPPTTSVDPSTRSTEMNRHNTGAANQSCSNRKDAHQSAPQISSSGNKKWSFGRLFRKKKEAESESSSEEDRKAGFVVSPKYRKKDKKKRGSKLIGGGFDHIVVSPARDNEFFLPFEPVSTVDSQQSTIKTAVPVEVETHSRSTNSLDRRNKRDRGKKPGAKDAQRHSSSEEEMVSLNSSTTFARYRSDESLGSGGPGSNGNGGQSRRSRAARNERYYKRLSRDGEVSHGQVPVMYAPQPAQRWKTQPVPLSIYSGQMDEITPSIGQKARPQYPHSILQSQNLQSSPHLGQYASQAYGLLQPPRNLQNTVNNNKRSISYDSQIHIQNLKKPLPPPPPPRDPLRRVNVAGHSDHRPISYAFDQNSSHAPSHAGMPGRCVSDDRIWSGSAPMYQSASSINNHPPSAAGSQNRRFITRAERDVHPAKKSLPSGLDFRYVAEAAPRSRKPIHLLDQEEKVDTVQPASPGIIRTTKSGLPGPEPSNPQHPDFWRRGRDQNPRSESAFNKPRSVSSSRASEQRSYGIPVYSEVLKPKSAHVSTDEVDNVVSGSLLIKPSKDNHSNYVEIRNNANKSNSMPNHYQRRELGVTSIPKADSPPSNNYDAYVAEIRLRNVLDQPMKVAPDPPQRKLITKPLSLPPEPDVIMRKKPTNLEDAINELEAIYKSLKLGDESLLDRAERRDIPTPTNFEKYAELHTGESPDDDDDDGPTKEPDLVRDDFAYRNIKHANLALKTGEKQPPFGIPIGPITPSPRNDYLHVKPDKETIKVRTGPFKYPDIVCDDLAVRTLRKDPLSQTKPQFSFPAGSLKKKRATRTQSANIYALIQRNAAKPSGGDLCDYLELTKTLERGGSMSDIHKETDDIPSTLQLLRNLREQEQGSPKVIPFRHPSQGGAICNLPAVLLKDDDKHATKHPIPLPRKSLSPDPEKTKMEDALNKIAKEAKESSEKLTRELMELRNEALITSSRPKVNKPSIERDLEQIEAVSEAARRCRHILMDTIPPNADEQTSNQSPPRRLASEDKLIKAIDQVSDAANKVCEKILNEIVTVEPPVIVQHAVEVKNRPKQELVMPSLIQKLDPSSARIGEIAERCMRQISELNDHPPDYDNLQRQIQVTSCNTNKNNNDREKRSDADLLIVAGSAKTTAIENEEEIDKIMRECEEQARNEVSAASSKTSVKVDDSALTHSDDAGTKTTTTTTTSASSSSDCLKSSSPSAGPHLSSSITSFNPYSSSDYIKSPSSEFHAPSTDPIKTFSTTSYDVQSSSVTPNITNSSFSYTPSPPLNLTPICSSGEKGERSGSASQYNSSEELAMIFGITKSSPATTTTGKEEDERLVVDCPVPSPVDVFRCSEPNKPDVIPISVATTTTTTSATNPEFCASVIACKLDTIDEDREAPSPGQVSRFYLPSYSNNISIIVTNVQPVETKIQEIPQGNPQHSGRQLDSFTSIDESSNPDSGNVSLSDFPVQSPINASLEVELSHNSRFEVANKFVNEVTINGGSAEVDYFRSLFAHDEVSTSFSNEEPEPEPEILIDHGDDQIDAKDQQSPGQLLHEVLNQVSRINAGTNRSQLISQLENISECTKIVEDLNERLSHPQPPSRLKDTEGGKNENRRQSVHRVRFSVGSDRDHEEDHADCLRSLQLLGHHLSSSEESIPPLGEIFNVPFTDSENEDSDRSSSVFTDQSGEVFRSTCESPKKSYEDEMKDLREALMNVVRSGAICRQCEECEACCSLEESLSPSSSEVVSIVEVVESNFRDRSKDPELQKLFAQKEVAEVSSLIEITDSGPKNRMEDPRIMALLSEPVGPSSEVISIVQVMNGQYERQMEYLRAKSLYSEASESDGCLISELNDENIELLPQGEQPQSDEDPSEESKSYLSPANISLKIVNQVSKVSFVGYENEEDFPISCQMSEDRFAENQIEYRETTEIKYTDSEKESFAGPEEAPFSVLRETTFYSTSNNETDSRTVVEVYHIENRALSQDLEIIAENIESDSQAPNNGDDQTDLPKSHTSMSVIESQISKEPSSTRDQSLPRHRQSSSEGSIEFQPQRQESSVSQSEENQTFRYRPSSSPANMSSSQSSSPTASKTLSLLAQPRYDDRMTTLEHILLACTFGVVTGNDLVTMLAIIIGVLTIIAIVLL